MQRTTVSRRLVPLLLVLAALVLIGDSIRLFLAPPGDQATIEADGVEAMLSISSKYILRARDCVAIEWAVTGADFVTLDGQRVPATGSGRYSPAQGLQDAPTQPLPEDYRPAPRTELGRDPSLTAHFNQQMELLNVRLPIYILLSDPLWGWRLVVAGLALLAAVRLRAGRPFEPRPTRVGANLVTVWLLTAVLVWVGLRLAQTWLGTSINPSGGLNLRLASTLLDILRYGAVMLVYAAALQLTGCRAAANRSLLCRPLRASVWCCC
ncbi:MAG: hypothetical protein ACFB51_04965 [Anaerolineae bacterium]